MKNLSIEEISKIALRMKPTKDEISDKEIIIYNISEERFIPKNQLKSIKKESKIIIYTLDENENISFLYLIVK